MNEKLELLNGLQAELEGMGIRITRIAVTTYRHFEGGDIVDTEVSEITMPCQSGYYHARCSQSAPGAVEVRIVREVEASIRGFDSCLREKILCETVRQLDGPTLKRLFIAATTRFSAPIMQDFALVCANWPVPAQSGGVKPGLDE
ncbi:MAG: hypothetical protein HYU66_07010 [Armatimonadetes bacterium]|nr:hypothetical protein [Armatimonadota bacterium]